MRIVLLPFLLFFSCITFLNGSALQPRKFFNIIQYGAIADGKTDNSKALLKAWRDACAHDGRSRVWIPRGTYKLDSVTFVGPCKGSMSFIIKGMLKAPTDPVKFFADTWIGFQYIENLTVKGGGILDGQGHVAWPYNDCYKNPRCKNLPATLRFDFVKNSRVHHLTSVNSKNSHINLFACESMNISQIRLTAPADSPNTDGIHIGISRNIKISRSIIQTGDDCISMVAGSQDIDIHDVACGPGHGISIGSLGRSHESEYVSGIQVRNCTFTNADNGLRIKTWAPSLYSLASNIVFQDIVMQHNGNPIIIDQQYCPSPGCNMKGESNSAVQIKNVTFMNVRGTSSTKVAVNIQCSVALPCKNVKLIDINLAYNGPGGRAKSECSHVIGSSSGKQVPDGCV